MCQKRVGEHLLGDGVFWHIRLFFIIRLMEKIEIKTLSVSESVAEKIKTYFGTVENSVEVSMMGRIPIVEVHYVDFKPTKQVRRDLESLFNDVDIRSLTRGYSRDSILNVVDEMMESYQDIYVLSDDSSALRRTNFREIIEETLYLRNL